MNRKDSELYRDDGLGSLRNTSGPGANRKLKNIIKILWNVDSLLLVK